MKKFSETMIEITSMDEYKLCKSRGFEPLLDARFDLKIKLRIRLQHQLFGSLFEHEAFYRWVWARKRHICEETMRPLEQYSAAYISHILTKGAHPEMAHDPRNINILCYEAHNQWEFGDRQKMRIFESNRLIIEKLKNEYKDVF